MDPLLREFYRIGHSHQGESARQRIFAMAVDRRDERTGEPVPGTRLRRKGETV